MDEQDEEGQLEGITKSTRKFEGVVAMFSS